MPPCLLLVATSPQVSAACSGAESDRARLAVRLAGDVTQNAGVAPNVPESLALGGRGVCGARQRHAARMLR